MILSNRVAEFPVPHTSTCVITTTGRIYDGDTVSIISPVFPSYNFSCYALNTSESFNVPIRIRNSNGYIDSDGNYRSTLVCDDNDTINMYVRET